MHHVSADSNDFLPEFLNAKCRIQVKQAEEKERLLPGVAYIAPPNYHLLVETDFTFSLSIEERVNYARPSIDVLFDAAAEAYCNQLIGVILTGANTDGSGGLKRIKENGGLAVVQDPLTAEAKMMPEAALALVNADFIAPLQEIGPLLVSLAQSENDKRYEESLARHHSRCAGEMKNGMRGWAG